MIDGNIQRALLKERGETESRGTLQVLAIFKIQFFHLSYLFGVFSYL